MDENHRGWAEKWADFLGLELASSLPAYAEVRDALRAGEWDRAERAIRRSPFASTSDGLTLRALLANARGDRATIIEAAQELEFRDRPQMKLWCLRTIGRTREAAALLREDWPEFREDVGVLGEGFSSAWVESDWRLLVALAQALDQQGSLGPAERVVQGWALEKRRRTVEAVDAYIRAYRESPSDWVPKRLSLIVFDREHADLEGTIYAFATEVDAERSDDLYLRALAVGAAFHRGRSARGIRLGIGILGRVAQRSLKRTVGRLASRLRSRKRPARSEPDGPDSGTSVTQ